MGNVYERASVFQVCRREQKASLMRTMALELRLRGIFRSSHCHPVIECMMDVLRSRVVYFGMDSIKSASCFSWGLRTDMAWACPSCEAKNKPRAVECENCGSERPTTATPKGQLPVRCWFDGGRLDAQGFCSEGQGFPIGIRCPFVCPRCRQCLEWSGACSSCYGSVTPADRATWTCPGARYETHDDDGNPIGDGQHWVKVAEPGRRVCTPEENRMGFVAIRRALVGTPVEVRL